MHVWWTWTVAQLKIVSKVMCGQLVLPSAQPILHQLDGHPPRSCQQSRNFFRSLCKTGQMDWTHPNRKKSLFRIAISTQCWFQRNQRNILFVVGHWSENVLQNGMPPIEYLCIAMLQNMDWCSPIVQRECWVSNKHQVQSNISTKFSNELFIFFLFIYSACMHLDGANLRKLYNMLESIQWDKHIQPSTML